MPSVPAARAGLESTPSNWGITGAGKSPADQPASQSAALTDLLNRVQVIQKDSVTPPTVEEEPAEQRAEFREVEQEKQNQKRAGSLFARIASFAQGARQSSAPQQDESRVAQAAQQPQLGIDPADRPRLSQEEEKLDIPAFLRRQSN
jgi:hypothetical protein